jgi:hypothetical protein
MWSSYEGEGYVNKVDGKTLPSIFIWPIESF